MLLRQFSAIFRMEFLSTLAYRADFILWALIDLIGSATLLLIWLAVYRQQSIIGGLTEAQMVTYYLGVAIVTLTVTAHHEWDIRHDIQRGILRAHLVRPTPYPLLMTIVAIVWRICTSLIVIPCVFLIIAFIHRSTALAVPYPIDPFFVVSLAATFSLWLAISASLGFLTFWFERSDNLIRVNGIFREFAAGSILPLALFPAPIQQVLAWTPYPYLVNFPVRIFSQHLSSAEIWQGIAITMAWTTVFATLTSWLWYRGLRRYDAPEGQVTA